MPRTSPEPGRNRPKHAAMPPTASVVTLSDFGAVADISVLEFCVGMALARHGPLTAREVAAELSLWLGKPVPSRALQRQLKALSSRGWARLDAGTYTLLEVGSEALRGFYSALVRMLDGGRRLLDVAVFMSLIKEFERSGS
jgi:hypothetical protein